MLPVLSTVFIRMPVARKLPELSPLRYGY